MRPNHIFVLGNLGRVAECLDLDCIWHPQRLSDCENHPAERAALDEVTQSVRRFA